MVLLISQQSTTWPTWWCWCDVTTNYNTAYMVIDDVGDRIWNQCNVGNCPKQARILDCREPTAVSNADVLIFVFVFFSLFVFVFVDWSREEKQHGRNYECRCANFFVASHRLIRLSAPGRADYAIILGRIMPSSRDGRDYGIIRTGIMPLSACVVSWLRADGNAWQASATLYLGCCARVCRNALRLLIGSNIWELQPIDSCFKTV